MPMKVSELDTLLYICCNIPDFWKVQKSQKSETFVFLLKQATKKPNRVQEQKRTL